MNRFKLSTILRSFCACPLRRRRMFLLWAAIGCAGWGAPTNAQADPAKIILIGGKKSHGPGEHDFRNGIPMFGALLKASPTFAGADILAFPLGWPADPAALSHASTVVLYFDGIETPAPLLEPARIAQIQKLMDAGVGLVCLHQASTVPPGNTTIPLVEWLGARRNGMVDRISRSFELKPAAPSHPISAGWSAFSYRDEFYPTLIFTSDVSRLTPILRVSIPGKSTQNPVVAWAFDRADGGRSFGFTGGHYLTAFEQPAIRKMLLNSIAWTAHLEVPAGGVETGDPLVTKSVVTKAIERSR